MKNFIKTIGLTFYSGDFYKKIKDEKTDQGIVFLLKTAVLLGLCVSVVGIILFLTFSFPLKGEIKNFIETNYPSDLVVTIKDGKMTTNTSEPFFVKIPEGPEESNAKENILVLLPNENADASLLTKYNTFLVMAADGIVGEEDSGSEIRIIKYQDWSLVFNKESALKMINKWFPFFLGFMSGFIIPLGIFLVMINITIHLIWLFLVALLIWGFLRLKKLDISYKQSYKIGMYAIVPLLFLEILAIPLDFSGKLFTTAIMLLVVLVVTHNWKREEIENKIITEEVKSV